MPADINSEVERWRVFQRFNRESLLIVLVSIACIMATAGFFLSIVANYNANAAQATAETWKVLYKETERECRLAQNKLDDFKMMMVREGFKMGHEGEHP